MREQGKNSPIWKEVRQIVDEKELTSKMNQMSLGEMNQREKDIMKNGEKGQG